MRDALKKRKNNEKFCCFIDILGFKDILGNFVQSNELYREMIYIVSSQRASEKIIIKTVNSFPEGKIKPDVIKIKPANIKIISDSIIITSGNWLNIITNARIIQSYLFSKGILIRGGIGYGRHVEHTASLGVAVVSEALSRAYLAESKLAIYPRIIFDKSALEAISDFEKEKNASALLNMRTDFIIDDMGVWFLNFDFSIHESPHNLLRKLYIEAKTEDVMKKIRWLIDFYNFCGYQNLPGLPIRHSFGPDFRRGYHVSYEKFGMIPFKWFKHITENFKGNIFCLEDWKKFEEERSKESFRK